MALLAMLNIGGLFAFFGQTFQTGADPWQLFAEVQANSKRTVFGGTLATAGARWWLNKDTLGLDLTAGRESGVHGATVWTLGLCWYGIGL